MDASTCVCEYLRMSTNHHVTLHRLPPERWGKRLARMRDLADLTQGEATIKLSRYLVTSGSTISRMEKLDAPPSSKRRRQLAWTLSVIYGFAPEDLDLTAIDAPPRAVLEALGCLGPDDADDSAPRFHGTQNSAQGSLFPLAACG